MPGTADRRIEVSSTFRRRQHLRPAGPPRSLLIAVSPMNSTGRERSREVDRIAHYQVSDRYFPGETLKGLPHLVEGLKRRRPRSR